MLRKLLFCVLLLSPLSYAADALLIKPDSKEFTYVGRFSDNFSFGWSASEIRFKVKGPAVSGLFTITKGKEAGVLVAVDGVPAKEKIIVTPDTTEYVLAENLPAGEHLIEICKTSEGYLGEIMFSGLKVQPGTVVSAAPAKERKILVIGDSITCGYGNEGPELSSGNNVRNENAWLGYPKVAARALDADVVTICWSGKGLFRDRSVQNDKTATLPIIFDRILPMAEQPKFDMQKYVPQVIAMNLGTNDMNTEKGKKPALRKDDYQQACRDFIKKLQGLYPQAQIILSIGPMELKYLVEWQDEVAKEFKNVSTLVYKGKSGNEYLGGHWHPSVKMDAIMGEVLAAKIKEVTGWK